MATPRQIAANQHNAQKSTGPTSEEGKAVSRGNALKHGLTAGIVLHEPDAAEVEQLHQEWWDSFGPTNEQEEWLVRDVVEQSLRIKKCHAYEAAILNRYARQADAGWDDAREADARKLARRLAKAPDVAAIELRKTKHGCLLLIERWEALAAAMDLRGEWSEAERSVAMGLMGIPLGLHKCPCEFDPPPGVEAKPHVLRLIENRVRSLQDRIDDYLDDNDEQDRQFAALRLTPFACPEWRALLRYENAARRRFDASWNRLVHNSPDVRRRRGSLAPPVESRPYPTRRDEPTDVPRSLPPEEAERRLKEFNESRRDAQAVVEPPAAPAVVAAPVPVTLPAAPRVVAPPKADFLADVFSSPRSGNRLERLTEKALARQARG